MKWDLLIFCCWTGERYEALGWEMCVGLQRRAFCLWYLHSNGQRLASVQSCSLSMFSFPLPAKRANLSRMGGGLSCPGVVTCIKIAWSSHLAFPLSLFRVYIRAVWFCLCNWVPVLGAVLMHLGCWRHGAQHAVLPICMLCCGLQLISLVQQGVLQVARDLQCLKK